MDRFFNSKRQNMTNYLDIFKACRLCGSGGGYKMPIIQKLHNDDVIDVEAELKQKIRECVSIDVHPNDRMPPLICELCVDKVNDFYEFREMCRATNTRVRASLGLPPQNLSQDINEDCILGVSGPVFHNSNDGDNSKKDKSKKKSLVEKVEKKSLRSSEPTPPPVLDRSSRRRHTNSPLPSVPAKKIRFSSPVPEKKKHVKASESLAAEAKRLREAKDNKLNDSKKGSLLSKQKELVAFKPKERDTKSKESPIKLKITLKAKDGAHKAKELKEAQKAKELKEALKAKELKEAQKAKELKEAQKAKELKEAQKAKELKEAQKAKLAEQKLKEAALKKKQAAAALAAAAIKCDHCSRTFSKQIEYKQHVNLLHTPLYTDEKLACTPCGEWFPTLKEAETHHKWHRTSNSYYTCQRCSTDFKVLLGFTKHFQRKQCIPYEAVPDVKCNVCFGMFATENWKQQHKCSGPPKDMCKKCLTVFQSQVSLKKHERTCKGVIVPVNPENPLLKEIRPLSIPIDRCDNILTTIKTEPGLITSIKQEPMDFEEAAIHIKQEIKQEAEDYQSDYYDTMDHDGYYSDRSASDAEVHPGPHMVLNPFARKNSLQVETLSVISLRSIFGGKLLGKQTKKRKKRIIKQEVVHPADDQNSAFSNEIENLYGCDTTYNDPTLPTDNLFDSLRSSAADHGQQSLPPLQDFNADSNTVSISDNSLAENVLNEIIEQTDAVLDGPSTNVEEKIDEDISSLQNTSPTTPISVTQTDVANSDDNIADNGDNITNSGDNIADNGDTITDSGDTNADNGDTIADSGDTIADSGDTFADSGDTNADNGDNIADNADTIADSGDTYADNSDTVADSGDTIADKADNIASELVENVYKKKINKPFVEGFALDPEVEALLMEDEEVNIDKDQETSTANDITEVNKMDAGEISSLNLELNSENLIHETQSATLSEMDTNITSELDNIPIDSLHHEDTLMQVEQSQTAVSATQKDDILNSCDIDTHQPSERDASIVENIEDIPFSEENLNYKEQISLNSNMEALMAVKENVDENIVTNTDMVSSGSLNPDGSSVVSEINDGIKQSYEDNNDEDTGAVSSGSSMDADNGSAHENNKKSEDVMDLISDSGDDCNIVDSPDKSRIADDLPEENKQVTNECAEISKDNLMPSIDNARLVSGTHQSQTLRDDLPSGIPQTNSKCLTEEELLEEDKQMDEESLLTGRDDGNIMETELTQQDEEILLGKDDPEPQEMPVASREDDLALEKISDDEFDID